jgi:hypothetical protein
MVGLRPGQSAIHAAARAHFDDPRTIVVSGLVFLVWARKPT